MSGLDHTLEPKGGSVRRIEVITGGGERRRRWSEDEKAEAVEESLQPHAVVSQVARRRGLTPQQLFSWRRAARRTLVARDEPVFAAVVVEPHAVGPMALSADCNLTTVRAHVIELNIDGANVRISREATVDMVTSIIGALKARS